MFNKFIFVAYDFSDGRPVDMSLLLLKQKDLVAFTQSIVGEVGGNIC